MKEKAPVVLVLALVVILVFTSLTGCERPVPEEPTPTLNVVVSPQAPPETVGRGPTTVTVLESPTPIAPEAAAQPEMTATPTPTISWDLPSPTFTPETGAVASPTPQSQPIAPSPTPTPVPPTSGNVTYTIEWGDTLYSLAARYGTSVDAIVAANNLLNPNLLRIGQTLTIPVGEPGSVPPSASQVYIVEPGDTLYGIAFHFNTSVAAIAQANGIVNPALIRPGQRLTIPGGGTGASAPRRTSSYTVQAGDTLTSIAARYGTTVWAIAMANNLPNADWVVAGQTLVIPVQ